jgi:hypothetical protein
MAAMRDLPVVLIATRNSHDPALGCGPITTPAWKYAGDAVPGAHPATVLPRLDHALMLAGFCFGWGHRLGMQNVIHLVCQDFRRCRWSKSPS